VSDNLVPGSDGAGGTEGGPAGEGLQLDEYKINLTGPGFSLERNIDGETASHIVGLLIVPDGMPRSTIASKREAGSAHSARQPTRVAVGEYVRETGAKRYADKILAIGAWLEDHQNASSFSRDDVKAQFRNLGEPPPQNMSRDFHTAVSYGWLSPDTDEPSRYWVTNTGREAIASNFPSDAKIRPKKVRPRKRAVNSHNGNDEV